MSIETASGDLLKADRVDALVNTVNCVGVMGKGIALQFKLKWPENYQAYEAACRRGEVQIGKMFVCDLGALATPKYIINFPTKEHWRGRSKIAYIRAGLLDLVEQIRSLNISSIAVPPLGAGNGGLAWDEVRPVIEEAFRELPDVEVKLFEPAGAPPPNELEVRTARPAMTTVRAALLKLLTVYRDLGYGLSKLEVQKLVYFLVAAGRPLPAIAFSKNNYGPYCDKLRHVLGAMEGHFIRGLGDGSTEAQIEPMPAALEQAEELLRSSDDQTIKVQVERVADLISGFETPYGLELLSTVHWVATNEPHARNIEAAVVAVQSWNARKKALFSPQHIAVAWNRLNDNGWMSERAH
ncbi:MAG TPA: macro domain-containing protein [Dokdonella sp.]